MVILGAQPRRCRTERTNPQDDGGAVSAGALSRLFPLVHHQVLVHLDLQLKDIRSIGSVEEQVGSEGRSAKRDIYPGVHRGVRGVSGGDEEHDEQWVSEQEDSVYWDE